MNSSTTADELGQASDAKMDKVQSRDPSWAHTVLHEAIFAGVSNAAIVAVLADRLPGCSLWLGNNGRVIAQGTHEPILPGATSTEGYSRANA